MFDALLRGPTPWIILAVVVLLFGATRLPALARSLGQSVKIFRGEMKHDDGADSAAPADSALAATPKTPAERASTSADGTSTK